MKPSHRPLFPPRSAWLGVAALGLAACGSTPPAPGPADAAAACAALAAPIGPRAIGLPTRGATIESAPLMAPIPLIVPAKLPFVPPPPEAVIAPASPSTAR